MKGKKTGGRNKGSINRKTAEEIDRAGRILDLIESEYLEYDIKELTAYQRMTLYADMIEYKAPKLSRTEVHGKLDNKIILEIVRHNKTQAEHTASPSTNGHNGVQKV